MADSFGGGFPSKGINPGHLFYDVDSRTLFAYTGTGDPRDEDNWTTVLSAGGAAGGSNVSVFRFPWKFIGNELSINLGEFGQINFLAPVAGRVSQWSIMTDSVGLSEIADMSLVFDPDVTFTTIDQFTVPVPSVAATFIRNVNFEVSQNDIISVLHNNTLNPADPAIKIFGHVDIIPSG